MKKYKFISILLAGSLTFGACSDFLDTESPSEQTPEVIFENEGLARSALMGVYSMMTGTYVYGQKMSVNWQGVSDIELASGYQDDPSTAGADNGIANYFCNWYLENTKWEDIFKMAELASTAVEGIRGSSLLSESNTLKGYLGEALVLRSLAYFELVRRYGDIPYKEGTSNSDLSNVYMGKIDRDSIYGGIIRDMQEAVDYLPWMGASDYNCERVTKGFAKGLLARIALFAGGWSVRDGNQFTDDTNVEHYPNTEANPGMSEVNGYYIGRPKNWQEYYAIAEQQCAELIGDPENPHQLDPDYGDIWKTVCADQYNTYNENMFEVANGVGYSGDIGTLMGRAMDGNIGYGQRGFGGSYVSTNAYYFYSFSEADKRRDYACYWPTYKSDNADDTTGDNDWNVKVGKGNREVMNNDIMNVKLGKWSFWWTSDSYRSIASTATQRTPTGINWILMRYSDVLLMFAEAAYTGLNTDKYAVEPYFGLSYMHVKTDDVKQSVGGMDFDMKSDNANLAVTTLGVRGAVPFTMGSVGMQVKGDVAWNHFFGDTEAEGKMRVADAGFAKVKGEELDNMATVGLGVEAKLTKDTTLGVSYTGAFDGDITSHGVGANLRINF